MHRSSSEKKDRHHMSVSMESPSTSRVGKMYHVFLSFRGDDTRRTIVSHLHKALLDRGIDTFKDDRKLDVGDSISDEIREAIRNSKIAVVVISENYATSTWCLNELQMIMELHKSKQLTAIPIFYNVAPSDVRHQNKSFSLQRYKGAKSFLMFTKKKQKMEERVRKWREALIGIAGISGQVSKLCENEAMMIEDIARRISRRLFSVEQIDLGDIVGMKAHMERLNPLLELQSTDDVRMVGIWGMGGIGKTTIAKFLYKEYSHQFAPHICFLENVRSSLVNRSLLDLQEKLLSNIVGEEHEKLWSVEQGCQYIRSRLVNRKVLLVLDDIDNLDQLHALAKETSWFGPGSRIIITTRDQGLLSSSGVKNVYCVDFLGSSDAIQVFKQVAFKGGEAPSDVYEQMSIRACSLAQGLASALKVFGTYLHRVTTVEDWEKALERLEKVPHQKIMEILRTSYSGLDKRHQAVFLHVACLFNGDSVQRVTSLLDDGGLEIEGLAEKSLIDISADGVINMHVLVEQAGKEFVREESNSTPWRQTVLWEHEQIISVLRNNTGTTMVQSLALHMCEMPSVLHIKGRVFKTTNLKFLKVFQHLNETESKLQFFPRTDGLPKQLRLLHWDAYPLSSLPPSYSNNLNRLVEINLRFSKVERLWSGDPVLPLLRRLDMSCSRNLIEFPGLSGAENLEELLMEGSTGLKKSFKSIGGLLCLRTLNLSHCIGIPFTPITLSEEDVPLENSSRKRRRIILQLHGGRGLHLLDNLSTDGSIYIRWSHLRGVAEHISCISERKNLHEVIGKLVEGVPQRSIFYDFKLLTIKRYTKHGVPFRCTSFSYFPCLVELKLINLNIQKIPDDIGHLQSLEKLDLSGNDFESLHTTMVNLSKLRSVRLCNCSNLESLPELTQLQTLTLSDCSLLQSLVELSPANHERGRYSLLELGLDNCKSIQSLSQQLSHFTNLIHLDLSWHDFATVPESISALSSLGTLCLNNCKNLESVEDLPESLKRLYAHGCDSLENVSFPPNHSIEHLDLSNCFSMKQETIRILNDEYSQLVTTRFACLPGNKVPSYFDNQALSTCTKISLPPIRAASKLLGFAACIVIACKTPAHLQFPALTYSWFCETDGVIRIDLKPNPYLSPEIENEEADVLHHLVIIHVPNSIKAAEFEELRLECHLQFPEETQFPPGEIIACGSRLVPVEEDTN